MADRILDKIQSSVPRCTYHVDVSVGELHHSIKQYNVDINPEYQRDHVWTQEQEELFVGAVLENYRAIPPFWFNWTKKYMACEVVDGKQRLKSLIRWLDGEIIAKCPCGINVWYKDLGEVDLRNTRINITLSWNFVELNRKEVMEFYIRLNNGGTIHTPEELDRVRDLIQKSS